MSDLATELLALQAELQTLIPKALENLAREGRITAADPLDAVGVSYVTAGNGSVFHYLAVRTLERRKVLDQYAEEEPEMLWNMAEYEINHDLTELVKPSTDYERLCERLTELTVDVLDARDSEDEDFSEFDQLEKAVREVAHWLTRNWRSDSVPTVEHPFFFALNWYQDDAEDGVARSVHRADLELAKVPVPEVRCRECEDEFEAPLHTPGDTFHCPSCGEVA